MHYLQAYPINCSLKSPSPSPPIKGPAPLMITVEGGEKNKARATEQRKGENWREEGKEKRGHVSLEVL